MSLWSLECFYFLEVGFVLAFIYLLLLFIELFIQRWVLVLFSKSLRVWFANADHRLVFRETIALELCVPKTHGKLRMSFQQVLDKSEEVWCLFQEELPSFLDFKLKPSSCWIFIKTFVCRYSGVIVKISYETDKRSEPYSMQYEWMTFVHLSVLYYITLMFQDEESLYGWNGCDGSFLVFGSFEMPSCWL